MLILTGTLVGLEVEPPRCIRRADGWDECVETIVASSQTAIAKGSTRSPTGIGGIFFVQETQPVGFKACYPVMEIRSVGVQSLNGHITESTGYGGRVSGNYAGIPGAPSGTHRGNVMLNRVGVTDRWWSASAPSSSVVATAQTPPTTFGLPSNPFSWTTEPSYNYPSGWVLEKRDAVPIAGSSYYFVVDYYSYFWLITPESAA
jgi:hypothetical protein